MYYAKQKPRVVKYMSYKNFTNNEFKRDIINELSLTNLQEDRFKCLAFKVLGSHGLSKDEHVRYNQTPFMNIDLRKAIMTRSRLLNTFRKYKTNENQCAYKNKETLP